MRTGCRGKSLYAVNNFECSAISKVDQQKTGANYKIQNQSSIVHESDFIYLVHNELM